MQSMVREVIGWGLRPRRITADSWYASLVNLKFWRGAELAFLVGVKSDRIVSSQPHQYEAVGAIETIPDDGLLTHLKGFGFIKLFRTVDPQGNARHYVVYDPDADKMRATDRQDFKRVKTTHWNVEKLFRALKQVCNLERFFVRKAQAVTNHVFSALCAFIRLSSWCQDRLFHSIYQVCQLLFCQTQRQFIQQMCA